MLKVTYDKEGIETTHTFEAINSDRVLQTVTTNNSELERLLNCEELLKQLSIFLNKYEWE